MLTAIGKRRAGEQLGKKNWKPYFSFTSDFTVARPAANRDSGSFYRGAPPQKPAPRGRDPRLVLARRESGLGGGGGRRAARPGGIPGGAPNGAGCRGLSEGSGQLALVPGAVRWGLRGIDQEGCARRSRWRMHAGTAAANHWGDRALRTRGRGVRFARRPAGSPAWRSTFAARGGGVGPPHSFERGKSREAVAQGRQGPRWHSRQLRRATPPRIFRARRPGNVAAERPFRRRDARTTLPVIRPAAGRRRDDAGGVVSAQTGGPAHRGAPARFERRGRPALLSRGTRRCGGSAGAHRAQGQRLRKGRGLAPEYARPLSGPRRGPAFAPRWPRRRLGSGAMGRGALLYRPFAALTGRARRAALSRLRAGAD